jgi:hypothetical protein
MLMCPLAGRAVREGNVVGGREFSGFCLPKPEGEVFGMVIAIARHDIEDHSPERFLFVRIRQAQSVRGVEQLRVGVGALHLEVEATHRAQGLDVVANIADAVESPVMECARPFFVKSWHSDIRMPTIPSSKSR